MPKKCVICKSLSSSFEKRSFHTFPKDELTRRKWIESLKLSNKIINFKTAFICSDHFDEKSFFDHTELHTRSRLHSDAVPQLINTVKPSTTVVIEGNSEDCNTLLDTNVNEETNNQINKTTLLNSSNLRKSDVLKHISFQSSLDQSFEISAFSTKDGMCCKNCDHDLSNLNSQTENNSSNCGRRKKSSDVKSIRRVRFMTGYKTEYICRDEFINEEAWNKFLRYCSYRKSITAAAYNRIVRKEKKINRLKGMIDTLEQKYALHAEYLKSHQLSLPDDRLSSYDAISTTFTIPDSLTFPCTSSTPQHAPSTSQQNNKQRKRKASIPEAKNIIANVYHYLQTEFENLKSYTGGSCDLSPLANILKRTATATGVSEETVTAILEEGKTSDESLHDSVPSKRALIQDFDDEDVSPIEEESSCGSADDAQHDDRKSEIDIEEHAIETLKVEVEDSDDEHSGARHGLWLQIKPLSAQKVPAIQQLLPPTHAEVKQEPVDEEVHELMEGGDAVEGTASVEDPLCESTSAVHHLLCSTNFEVKSEPTDDVYQENIMYLCMEFSTSSTTQVERRPD